jgi:hypothetical protein
MMIPAGLRAKIKMNDVTTDLDEKIGKGHLENRFSQYAPPCQNHRLTHHCQSLPSEALTVRKRPRPHSGSQSYVWLWTCQV